ncbi:hypothetical protein [Paracoccus angustae]|uniref:hypothetical protein n=1 Tax=Paracoccus angustae TaxID=1671480 RepID=UPI00366B0E01
MFQDMIRDGMMRSAQTMPTRALPRGALDFLSLMDLLATERMGSFHRKAEI